MSGAFEIAGVGLQTQQKALDTIANNIANINTAGFKKSDVQFSEVMAMPAEASNPLLPPEGASLAGVRAAEVALFDKQGELESTGRALDIAIDGAGFVELLGPDGQFLLWRGGALSVSEDGFLAGPQGYLLSSMIAIPQDADSIEISSEGRVRVITASGTEPVDAGQISLVRPSQMSALERVEGGLFRVAEGAETMEAMASEDGMGRIAQGFIERSNVDLNQEMVQMLIVQRAYAANAQVVRAADEILGVINGLRR